MSSSNAHNSEEESKQISVRSLAKNIPVSATVPGVRPEEVNVSISEVTEPLTEEEEIEFLEACFKGTQPTVIELIQTFNIKDIGMIEGYKEKVKFNISLLIDRKLQISTKTYDTAIWNPLLLAVAGKHC